MNNRKECKSVYPIDEFEAEDRIIKFIAFLEDNFRLEHDKKIQVINEIIAYFIDKDQMEYNIFMVYDIKKIHQINLYCKKSNDFMKDMFPNAGISRKILKLYEDFISYYQIEENTSKNRRKDIVKLENSKSNKATDSVEQEDLKQVFLNYVESKCDEDINDFEMILDKLNHYFIDNSIIKKEIYNMKSAYKVHILLEHTKNEKFISEFIPNCGLCRKIIVLCEDFLKMQKRFI